jgi:hypothetical protein
MPPLGLGEAVMQPGVGLCPRPRGGGLGRIGGVPRSLQMRPRTKWGDGLVRSRILLEAQQGEV